MRNYTRSTAAHLTGTAHQPTQQPMRTPESIMIGTAGWSLAKAYAPHFPRDGSHLERYAQRFSTVEINTSFYRPHRIATYEKWAAAVPAGFRFAVKVPRAITHERRLIDVEEVLARFLAEVAGLGPKLGPLLLQLPPSLAFDRASADPFLATFRRSFAGDIVCEPRHATWFTQDVDKVLCELAIARVAADPAPIPDAGRPGGWLDLAYYRLHGSPSMYRSAYEPPVLIQIAERLHQKNVQGGRAWCIFDNTAEFAAIGNALETLALSKSGEPPPTSIMGR